MSRGFDAPPKGLTSCQALSSFKPLAGSRTAWFRSALIIDRTRFALSLERRTRSGLSDCGTIEASQPSRSDLVRLLTSRSPNLGKKCFSRRPLVSAAVRKFFAVSHRKYVSAATRTVGGCGPGTPPSPGPQSWLDPELASSSESVAHPHRRGHRLSRWRRCGPLPAHLRPEGPSFRRFDYAGNQGKFLNRCGRTPASWPREASGAGYNSPRRNCESCEP